MVVEAQTRSLVANVAGSLCLRGGESLLGVKERYFRVFRGAFDWVIVVLMFVRERGEKDTWGSVAEWAWGCCKLSNAVELGLMVLLYTLGNNEHIGRAWSAF